MPKPSTVLLYCLLSLATTACGNDVPANETAPTLTDHEKAEHQLHVEYQALFELFQEYVMKKAVLSTALQDAHFQPGSPEIEGLHRDERYLQTTLNVCYEYAYRPRNFETDELRRMVKSVDEFVQQRKRDAPDFSGLPIDAEPQDEFAKARNGFVDYLAVFFRALDRYLDARD